MIPLPLQHKRDLVRLGALIAFAEDTNLTEALCENIERLQEVAEYMDSIDHIYPELNDDNAKDDSIAIFLAETQVVVNRLLAHKHNVDSYQIYVNTCKGLGVEAKDFETYLKITGTTGEDEDVITYIDLRQEDVYDHVVNFFIDNNVTCVEAIQQSDKVIENAYALLEDLFEIVEEEIPKEVEE